jgi:hypothetical protein
MWRAGASKVSKKVFLIWSMGQAAMVPDAKQKASLRRR